MLYITDARNQLQSLFSLSPQFGLYINLPGHPYNIKGRRFSNIRVVVSGSPPKSPRVPYIVNVSALSAPVSSNKVLATRICSSETPQPLDGEVYHFINHFILSQEVETPPVGWPFGFGKWTAGAGLYSQFPDVTPTYQVVAKDFPSIVFRAFAEMMSRKGFYPWEALSLNTTNITYAIPILASLLHLPAESWMDLWQNLKAPLAALPGLLSQHIPDSVHQQVSDYCLWGLLLRALSPALYNLLFTRRVALCGNRLVLEGVRNSAIPFPASATDRIRLTASFKRWCSMVYQNPPRTHSTMIPLGVVSLHRFAVAALTIYPSSVAPHYCTDNEETIALAAVYTDNECQSHQWMAVRIPNEFLPVLLLKPDAPTSLILRRRQLRAARNPSAFEVAFPSDILPPLVDATVVAKYKMAVALLSLPRARTMDTTDAARLRVFVEVVKSTSPQDNDNE